MKDKYCIVISTFETIEQAQPIIDKVLDMKLAACIQTINIGSHYRWNGSICHDKEILVLFKTLTTLYDSLRNELELLHPYETPEIIRISIEDGATAYLKWIDDVTK